MLTLEEAMLGYLQIASSTAAAKWNLTPSI